MNKLFLLLVVIGLAGAGWFNRERISEWIGERTAKATRATTETEKPPATPNPAPEAVAQAKKIYPALAKAGSPFNLRFVALYNEMKTSNPDFLTRANWPILLSERTAKEMGGGALPRSASQRPFGWTDNYAEAVEVAKSENKKLLLDFTGSDWCGYCMDLEKEVLTTSKFQAWARDHVVLVKVDFPKSLPQSTRVQQQNADLKSRYPFESYPTILVLDTNGSVLGRKVGYSPGSGPDAYVASLQNIVRR